jgi:cell cycle sensor histidine kinase DivJ
MLDVISNAIIFTKRGGKVTISADSDPSDVTVMVEDTGVGIGTEDLPRIGDPFFQARSSYDRRHDGTGLGLSIVKGLLRLHGGRMEIDSKLGEGTRVTIRLPVDCETARKRSESAPLRQAGQNGNAAHNTNNASDNRVRISA